MNSSTTTPPNPGQVRVSNKPGGIQLSQCAKGPLSRDDAATRTFGLHRPSGSHEPSLASGTQSPVRASE